jgi:VCBS repeat-containing protein
MSATPLQAAGTLALVAILLGAPLHAGAGAVAPGLSRALAARAPGDEVDVIVQLAERVDPSRFAIRDRRTRDGRLGRALREASARNLPPVLAELRAIGARGVRELWIAGAVAATVPAGEVARLAALPGVQQVKLDAVVEAPASSAGSTAPAEWNLDAIGAPALWGAGLTGEGAVVAGLDTGVDAAHPDLQGTWRGGSNSWFDPYGQHATPADASGHGTQTMGIMVGGAAGGSAIGVAPGARWIAARIYDDAGRGTLSGIHQAFQWILDPDGNPATVDAPDVVTAAWTLASAPGTCDLEFQADLAALEAAGIGVILAAGNDGPASGTSDSPANDPGAFSAGAVDVTATVASFSSRGPSACDGSIFPTLVAPGVDVRTSDLSFGGFASYAYVSGTSFAAPHVAGALALLAAAAPAASLAQLRSALIQGAVDLAPAGADDASGHGALDVSAALGHLGLPAGSPPTITSSPVTTATAGALYLYQARATDPDGTAIAWSLDAAPAGMTVGASTGLVTWTPGAGQEGANAVTARATDGSGQWATQPFTIQVAAANQPPVAAADAYPATSGVALSAAAPGVLANDSDPDGDPITAVLVSGPAHGVLAIAADGAFTYTASAGYSGTDAFTYAPSDGQLLGAAATVTITVQALNQPPVAANDTARAPIRRKVTYTPVVIKVLANDRDPDGSLVASSVRIATAPGKGGTAVASANGTVSYTPKLNFKGTETFSYDVRDDRGAVSNAATVTVTVK